MKILSRMLSKKVDPQEAADFQRDREELALDDAGQVRRSRNLTDGDDPIAAKPEEPEVAGSGWGQADDWDDDWDDDEDWGAEDEPDVDIEARRQTQDKQHLVSEIREAMVSVSHVRAEEKAEDAPSSTRQTSAWSDDEEFGRRARARSQLTAAADETEERQPAENEKRHRKRDVGQGDQPSPLGHGAYEGRRCRHQGRPCSASCGQPRSVCGPGRTKSLS